VTPTTQSFQSAFTVSFKMYNMHDSISDTLRVTLRRME